MSPYMSMETRRPLANMAVRFRDVPICQYHLSVSDEKRIYSPREFLRIYQNMALIREFETMISDLKFSGSYQGIDYPIKNTVALDIGKEAISVGEAYCFGQNDILFSSEKSIGDLIAKGLSSIAKMTDYEVVDMMRKYHSGAILSVVAEAAEQDAKPKDVAIDFLFYGILCEIFSKITGFHYGLGDASNIFFEPLGIYPGGSVTATSAGFAVGAAVYKKNMGLGGSIIANMNEDAACDGRAWEAFCLSESGAFRAANKQYEGLPILFAMNRTRENGEDETVIKRCISRICAGLDANSMHAETVNGSDPLAVIDAVTRKKERLSRGEGPALLEFIFDDLTVNPEGVDPVRNYRRKLIENEIVSEADIDALDAIIINRMKKICALAADDEKSPRASAENLEAIVYGSDDEKTPKNLPNGKLLPEVRIPKNDSSRLKTIAEKVHSAYSLDGTPVSKEFRYNISDAFFESVTDMLYTDPRLIVCGMQTDAPDIYDGLSEMVPNYRFFRVSSSEQALVSLAVGYVMCGGCAVVSLKNADSLANIADVLIRQIAKWRAMSGGELRMPIVLRVPVTSKKDTQNADELLSLVSAIPGLKVIYPVTPYDAKGLMASALKENNPVVCFENQRLYDVGEYFEKSGVPEKSYMLPIGTPSLKREGRDLTILTFGASLYRAMDAAKVLDEVYGIQAEIMDACSVVPFDYTPVLKSIEKTGKILIVGEGTERGSVMRDIASGITEFAFDLLDAPPITLGSRNWITPPAVYSGYYYPTAATILDVIHQRIMTLEGYEPLQYTNAEEKLRRSAKGL